MTRPRHLFVGVLASACLPPGHAHSNPCPFCGVTWAFPSRQPPSGRPSHSFTHSFIRSHHPPRGEGPDGAESDRGDLPELMPPPQLPPRPRSGTLSTPGLSLVTTEEGRRPHLTGRKPSRRCSSPLLSPRAGQPGPTPGAPLHCAGRGARRQGVPGRHAPLPWLEDVVHVRAAHPPRQQPRGRSFRKCSQPEATAPRGALTAPLLSSGFQEGTAPPTPQPTPPSAPRCGPRSEVPGTQQPHGSLLTAPRPPGAAPAGSRHCHAPGASGALLSRGRDIPHHPGWTVPPTDAPTHNCLHAVCRLSGQTVKHQPEPGQSPMALWPGWPEQSA